MKGGFTVRRTIRSPVDDEEVGLVEIKVRQDYFDEVLGGRTDPGAVTVPRVIELAIEELQRKTGFE